MVTYTKNDPKRIVETIDRELIAALTADLQSFASKNPNWQSKRKRP